MITFLGGVSITLPGIVTTCCGIIAGSSGGFSRKITGSGVLGRAGTCLKMIGGGACLIMSFSCLIIRSPCGGGGGGFKS
jgi:hypothetical protein